MYLLFDFATLVTLLKYIFSVYPKRIGRTEECISIHIDKYAYSGVQTVQMDTSMELYAHRLSHNHEIRRAWDHACICAHTEANSRTRGGRHITVNSVARTLRYLHTAIPFIAI